MPAVLLKIGTARVTESIAVSLSRVTARGVEITCVSASALRKEEDGVDSLGVEEANVGRKAVQGVQREPAVARSRCNHGSSEAGVVVVMTRPPGSVVVVVLPGVTPVVAVLKPLPKVTFCAANVPVESTPFTVLGLREISIRRALLSGPWRVGVSRRLTSSSTELSSFSVATTTNWLLRTSPMTLLRLSVKVAWTEEIRFVMPAYLSWMMRVIRGAVPRGL